MEVDGRRLPVMRQERTRVFFSLLLLVLLTVTAVAEEAAWKLTLEQRAARRADPVANAARREAAAAKGRSGFSATDNVVYGDPSVIAPIELVDRVIVFNLPPDVAAKRRHNWMMRGAADILGPDFWNRLQVVFSEVIAHDRGYRRPGAVPLAPLPNENPECAATANALVKARVEWGRETFDRFLYEVVAPDVFFYSSSSDPAALQNPEHWVEEWKWLEAGCR
jgi:hypothetical protein